jgi:hypothetical protein
MRGRRLVFAAIATVLIVWLMRTAPPPRPLYPIHEPPPTTELGAAFDPARCGIVRGEVRWSGDVPAVAPIELVRVRNPPAGMKHVSNPNVPRVTGGRLADAVVRLIGIEAARSAPWPEPVPTTSVEVTRTALVVKQGGQAGRVAVVRRGQEVELVALEDVDTATSLATVHSVRGRGAAFFTQMLATANRPVSRPMPEAGVVELSSGAGYYWLRGYLFVSDDPYAAVTGGDGTFSLSQVPDGEYEAVCWVPNWHIERWEHDPEWSGDPVRLFFKPAVEKRQRLAVKAGQFSDLHFTFSAADFDRGAHPP